MYYDFNSEENKYVQNVVLILLTIAIAGGVFIAMRNYFTPQPFDDGILLDVQKESTYKQSHIPGSINIPYGTLNKRITKEFSDLETHINLYSHSSSSADKAYEKLKKLGYKNVRNLGSLERARKLLLDKALSSIE